MVRHSRVVDDARLDMFVDQLRDAGTTAPRSDGATGPGVEQGCRLTPVGVLNLMVTQGLLTRYQATELAAGRSQLWVGGYLILDLLGRGGMGQVFLAEHALLRKRVAIKILSHGAQPDEMARARFHREARAAAALDHPNIVRVFDVNTAHDPPFLVMEYVDGVSLQAAVARYGVFPAGEAAAVGLQIARGLQPAAEVGLVHRDIKPANILVDRKGGVKVLDLGIARFESDPVSLKIDTLLVVGTIDYLAPEQALDSSNVDTRADLYALGATLYYLLAGHPPHPEADLSKKLARKQSADPPWLDQFRPDVPHDLAGVIARLLARCPADRYPTPAAAAAALAPWVAAGADFPDRLFRPWQPIGAETPGQPTVNGDHPTLLPPTGRILQRQTERPNSKLTTDLCPETISLPATPPQSAVPPGPVEAWPDTASIPAELAFAPGMNPDESGNPTVVLRVSQVRRGWLRSGRVWWWVLATGAVIAGFIGGVVASAAATADGPDPDPDPPVAPYRS
ncbi:MAG: pkn0 [Gemmataceae bacterium]|nr:pkn0 [Gemmataceae bacterium]